jgi:outer membrane protein OmpA-like peptidoglycan-associated protein/Tol biopolymer transport system component
MKSCALILCLIVLQSCASSYHGPIVNADQVKKHDEVLVRHLEAPLNSSEDDFDLQVLASRDQAVFTSTRATGAGRQDIYSISTTKLHTPNGNVASLHDLNTVENEGCATFTPDGLTMYFAAASRDGSMGSSDLYQADFVAGKWTNVRNLNALNTEYWESHPSLAADGRTLYFVSDRPGGIGGQDIYVSTRVGDNWTAPQNLGTSINTPGHEASPFIAADGKTLYFSSEGRAGLGGYDVYVSRNVGGVWSEPENAGTPINSTFDDLFYTAELGTQHAFVSSNRDSTLGGLDIFSVEPNPFASGGVTVVRGTVRDAVTHQALGAAVTISNLESGEDIARFRSDDSTGEYLVVLQPGGRYSITAEAPGYLFYSDLYEVERRTDVTLQHDIDLSPSLTGKTRLLVFFDFNSANLKNESTPDLNRAVSLLKDFPSNRVVVTGYTDSIGSAEFNQRLSESRAVSVRQYLMQHGIDGSRVDAIGLGEANPIATNETEEGRALNRRVEFQLRK